MSNGIEEKPTVSAEDAELAEKYKSEANDSFKSECKCFCLVAYHSFIWKQFTGIFKF